MTEPEPERCHIIDDPAGPIVVRGTGPFTSADEAAFRALAAAVDRMQAERDPHGEGAARQEAAAARNHERNERARERVRQEEERVTAIADQALVDAHTAAVAAAVPVWHQRVDDHVEAPPEGHLQALIPAAFAAAVPILQAAALRAYAGRWHGHVEGYAQPTDYGTGVEYDAACQCGMPLLVDDATDRCGEHAQLLADAAAIEAGQPFRDVAEEST